MNQPEPLGLSRADRELVDRLLSGEPLSEVIDANDPDRAQRVSRLLSLLDHWEAGDPDAGLTQRTFQGVLGADPVTLSKPDGEALDTLLGLRRQGLTDGPMPAGVRGRVDRVRGVLSILDRATSEQACEGLAERTLQAIERDRLEQRQRAALSTMAGPTDTQGTIGIRQVATTAALLLMAISILLPMLSNAQRNAQIAQCSGNLAGLGADLQQIAFDYQGETHKPAQPEDDVFNPLAKFARTNLDGSPIPAAQASFFVLMDQRRVNSKHLACPTGSTQDPAALYNGQNPAAGGPFRIFLKARPIFADANPLYTVTPKGLVRDASVSSLTRSANHDGLGQNVLISDGSVRWMIRPALVGDNDKSDNIWLYQPDNNSDQGNDVFLTP